MKRKDILYIILPPIIQSLFYFVTKLVTFKPHLITSVIDDKIPFISFFVYFYIFWYLMLVLAPYIIYKYHHDNLSKYAKVFFINSIICLIIFIIYPTTITRATFDVNSLSTYLVNLIYYFDTPILNCFPSLHALNSLMWIIYIGGDNKVPRCIRVIVTFISVCIILSTLFIKQHVIYDLIGSLVVLVIGYIIYKITKK